MRRIDAHQHFWLYNETDYVWMGSIHNPIRRNFLPEDLAPLLDSVAFDGSIAVQARQSLVETEWLLDLAEHNNRILGVVGWIDLCSADVGRQIEKYCRHSALKGVRHVIHDEPDDDFMLRQDFRRGVGLLAGAGLVYDLLLFPQHIPRAVRLVDEFPDQRFVVDHIAKPAIADRVMEPWGTDLAELARRENVSCKLSGMVTEADDAGWVPEDFAPYIDVVLSAFGPDRVMIGSDWPVCTIAGDYSSVVNVVLGHIGKLSTSEREAIVGGTCERIYNLHELQLL